MNNFKLNVKYLGLVVRDTIMYIWFIPDLLYAIVWKYRKELDFRMIVQKINSRLYEFEINIMS